MFYNVWENLKIKFYNLSHPQDDFVPAGTTPLSGTPPKSPSFSFSPRDVDLKNLSFETKRLLVLAFCFISAFIMLGFLRTSYNSYSVTSASAKEQTTVEQVSAEQSSAQTQTTLVSSNQVSMP